MFLVPHNYTHQFSNMQGDKPVRLLQYSYMPLTLSGVRDANLIFGNSYEGSDIQNEMDFYSEAKMISQDTLDESWGRRAYWYGNFFPDMRAWDKLDANVRRGAGGRSVYIQFADSEMSCHMSVFDARLYKKAHRHGPGRVIVIPGRRRLLDHVGGRQRQSRRALARSELLHAAEQMVSPALQRWRRTSALFGTPSTETVSRPRRESRRSSQRSDRICQRRYLGEREVQRRIGEARTHFADAHGSIHGPEFRVELEAVFEEREVALGSFPELG